MSESFETVLEEGPLRLVFRADEGRPSLSVAGSVPVGPVELSAAGLGPTDHHGSKHTGGQPGRSLTHRRFDVSRNAHGRLVRWELAAPEVEVTGYWQFFDGLPVIRSWVEVRALGTELVLEYVASLAVGGMTETPWDSSSHVHLGHNTWYGEAQWQRYSLAELGLHKVNAFSMKRVHLGQSGTWPTSEHLPMGFWEQKNRTWAWQIEHQGGWHWEISDLGEQLYLQLSGPTYQEHGWAHRLKRGQSFTTVPAALAVASGVEAAAGVLTEYRRRIRRPHRDLTRLPVIFNDYMNCLMGDPTTEKLLPLIDAAAEAGCEVFCIDAGWYADGYWFDGVGEWLPSAQRFPGGIEEPLNRIRERGMVPGLWLEIEVMGIKCPLASKVPEEWFFQRNGRRVTDNGRHFLDFRHPGVRRHADAIVDRLVLGYGAGYIKMDYNNNAGLGTELDALTPGDGLLGHQRAYLTWLEAVMDRYPDLVIENCGSGGMRMEYALLSRHPIQSVSDQTDYLKMAAIAAGCPTAVTPEQAAIWSYPLRDADREAAAFNMINALLLRIHQSGHLAELGSAALEVVHQGIALYKTWRERLPHMTPFWPLGWPSFEAGVVCLGLRDDEGFLLAVWNVTDVAIEQNIPLKGISNAALTFPSFAVHETLTWGDQGLTIALPPRSARIVRGQI
jgi:alpha-galactosidase